MTEETFWLDHNRLHEPEVLTGRFCYDFVMGHVRERFSFRSALGKFSQHPLLPGIRHPEQGIAHPSPHACYPPAMLPRQPAGHL